MLKELPGRSGSIRRFGAATALAVAATLLAGCAAGQHAQTVGQQPPIDGTSASAGEIAIRAAGVITPANGQSYDKGSSAMLQLVLVNNGATDTTLTSVTSPAAGSAVVSSSGASAAGSQSASDSTSASDSASSSASSSASASDSASSSASASAEPSATGSAVQASTPIQLPAGQSVQIGFTDGGPSISLNSLTAPLFPAQTVPVTFTFGNGSTVTTNLSVKLSTDAPSAPVVSDATGAND